MRLLMLALVVAAFAFASVARASDLHVATVAGAEDVSLPLCATGGYDWDERCYSEDGVPLAVGGELDKVWRSALRFSTALNERSSLVQDDGSSGALFARSSSLRPRLTIWYLLE